MKKIMTFDSAPNYCFSDGEETVLVWPEEIEGKDKCFRCREKHDGETFEYRIFGYDFPTSESEFDEIINNIATGDQWALEWL